MNRLKFFSCGDLISEWPVPHDVAIMPLVHAIDRVVRFYKRFGPCSVVLVDQDGVAWPVAWWRPEEAAQ
jgi:hypothetical protein